MFMYDCEGLGSKPRQALRPGKKSGSPCQGGLTMNGGGLDSFPSGETARHRRPFQTQKQALLPGGIFLSTYNPSKQKSHSPLAGFKWKVWISNKQAEPLHGGWLIGCSTHLSCRHDLESKDELAEVSVYTIQGTICGFLVTQVFS